MFWRLDNNEAVNVAGIPDANLRGLLEVLFGYLNLLKAQEVCQCPVLVLSDTTS